MICKQCGDVLQSRPDGSQFCYACHGAKERIANLEAQLADREARLAQCAVAWRGLKNLTADDEGHMENIYLRVIDGALAQTPATIDLPTALRLAGYEVADNFRPIHKYHKVVRPIREADDD